MPEILLKELAFCLKNTRNNEFIKVCGLSFDSRRCKKGDLFFCKGGKFKREYAVQAYKNGAVGIVCAESDREKIRTVLPKEAVLTTDNMAHAMALCAAHFYGNPMKKLVSVAVTGTKGKSTTVHYINSVLNAQGFRSAVLSSLVEEGAPRLTTPEAIDFHAAAYKAVRLGCTHIVCEISSQAQKALRTYGVTFDYACFLNFGRDHIGAGEHANEREYFECKRSLFEKCRKAIINTDDKHGKMIYDSLPSRVEGLSFSQTDRSADYHAEKIQTDGCGCDLLLFKRGNDDAFPISIFAFGEHNIGNALCAAAVARELGTDKRAVFLGIASGQPNGRGTFLSSRDGKITVAVDYAHNEMSFEAMFKIAETQFAGAIVSVIFGCPGDKAQSRRYQLARICADNADKVVICEDDSGEEGYESIAREMRQHFESVNGRRLCKYAITYIKDRKNALDAVIKSAEDSSEKHIIFMLGKGNEGVNRGCGCDEACETDESIASSLVEKYDNKAAFCNTVCKGAYFCRSTVCIDEKSDLRTFASTVSKTNEKYGRNREFFAVCSKKNAKELEDVCFSLGIATLLIEEKELSTSLKNLKKKIKTALNIGILPIFTAENAQNHAAKVAKIFKADDLVYFILNRGILSGVDFKGKNITYRRLEFINKSFRDEQLVRAEAALKTGVKRVAFLDDQRLFSEYLAGDMHGAAVFEM